jgi:hypothetical protein
MTLDARIASDLAALGCDDRQHVPGLERLRALAAPRSMAASAGVPALRLLAVARVHARRARRIAWGATALAIAVLFAASPWFYTMRTTDRVWWGSCGLGAFCASVGVLALAACSAAGSFAARRFERRLRRAAERGDDLMTCARRLAARLDFPALAFAIAGLATFAIVIGKLVFLDLLVELEQWFVRGYFFDTTLDQTLVDTTVAVLAVATAAAVIAAAVVRGRVALAHGAVVAAGLALGIATVCVGTRLDGGGTLHLMYSTHNISSHPLRIALTAAGSLAVLLVVAGLAARRRRHELAVLDGSAT